MITNNKLKQKSEPWDRFEPILRVALGAFSELFHGIWYGVLPLRKLVAISALIYFSIYFHFDYWLAKKVSLVALYPKKQKLFEFYYLALTLAPFFIWGLKQNLFRRRLFQKLEETCLNSNLQNRLGNAPTIIADYPKDEVTRILRLRNVGLPISQYQKAKEYLETNLSIFIDSFEENRSRGTIDIIYSDVPMDSYFESPNHIDLKPTEFWVGRGRAKDLKCDFDTAPHLLVAGQTGGGKSTFLRQLIVTLYLNDPHMKFILVDLKGGMEFQLFEDLPRAFVPESASSAVGFLSELSLIFESRMKEFKATKAKDVSAFETITGKKIERYSIVVDEAAEMFLPGVQSNRDDVNSARRILSQIARQGRSLGIHLIIATQRPDVKALDPQVKANLTGVLCFQMVNDASSISVLGTGRATDLPAVPGRAIWKCGADMVEVQTPCLTVQRAEKLLESHFKKNKSKRNISFSSKKLSAHELNPEETLSET